MNVVMTFDLPEDQHEYNIVNNASKYYCILWDVSEYNRKVYNCKSYEFEKYLESLVKDLDKDTADIVYNKVFEAIAKVIEDQSEIIGNLLEEVA